jgi:hypothetical protein
MKDLKGNRAKKNNRRTRIAKEEKMFGISPRAEARLLFASP